MKRRLPIAGLTALASVALVVVCHGRVFQRSGAAGGDSAGTLRSAGGRIVYQAPVTVNGGRGDLTVFDFGSGADSVAAKLARLFSLETPRTGEGGLNILTARSGGKVLRLLVLSFQAPARAVVMAIEQTDADFAASSAPPSPSLLKDLPAFPGSTPLFYAADEKRGTRLAVSAAASDPATILAHVSSQLSADGWTAFLPAPAASGLKLFVRDRQACCVMAAADGAGRSRITVLHNRRGME